MRVYHNGVKKRLALLLALAMLALSLGGCGKAGPIDEGFWQQPSQHSYRAELSLDEAAKAVSGRMTVTYKKPDGRGAGQLAVYAVPQRLRPSADRAVSKRRDGQGRTPAAFPKAASCSRRLRPTGSLCRPA